MTRQEILKRGFRICHGKILKPKQKRGPSRHTSEDHRYKFPATINDPRPTVH